MLPLWLPPLVTSFLTPAQRIAFAVFTAVFSILCAISAVVDRQQAPKRNAAAVQNAAHPPRQIAQEEEEYTQGDPADEQSAAPEQVPHLQESFCRKQAAAECIANAALWRKRRTALRCTERLASAIEGATGAPNERASASVSSKHVGEEQLAAVWAEGCRVCPDICSLCNSHPTRADLPVWRRRPAPVADQQRCAWPLWWFSALSQSFQALLPQCRQPRLAAGP